jgi:hypothetical protein
MILAFTGLCILPLQLPLDHQIVIICRGIQFQSLVGVLHLLFVLEPIGRTESNPHISQLLKGKALFETVGIVEGKALDDASVVCVEGGLQIYITFVKIEFN